MFWKFGTFAAVSPLHTLLDRPDVTLEEILNEADLLQELKHSNPRLLELLREEEGLKKLLEYAVSEPAPKPEDFGDEDESSDDQGGILGKSHSLSPFRKKRTNRERSKQREEQNQWEQAELQRAKYAYNSCEILSSDTWSIVEALLDNHDLLRDHWNFIRRPEPLNSTAASYFTKINEVLIDQKPEEMIAFLETVDDLVPKILDHIDCAAIMDLLLKIISMESSEGGAGVIDWLQSENLIPRLLGFLDEGFSAGAQTSAGDFMKAVVTISANASQNEQSCIGPNNLTRQLVSQSCMESLLENMLRGGNPLTVGVGLIIEIIRKNNSDYDPKLESATEIIPSSSDPIYLGTMLRCFAKRVPDFMALLYSPTHSIIREDKQITVLRTELGVASGRKIEPLGFDRFKTCELMAELLHCSNMTLLNERGGEEFVRRRDEERERLKREGMLRNARPPESAVTEFSEDSGFNNGASPFYSVNPVKTRQLGVANSSVEDDGFEDVRHPADEAEDFADEFDEKSTSELNADKEPTGAPPSPKPTPHRLDLDDEFIEDPLGSPKVDTFEGKVQEIQMDDVPAPLKVQTRLISSKVESLERDTNKITISGVQNSDTKSDSGRPSLDTTFITPSENNETMKAITSGDHSTLSPHAQDKPAPLFTSKSDGYSEDIATAETFDMAEHGQLDHDHILQDGSVRLGGSEQHSDEYQDFDMQFEYDIDGEPMVGDFLKIMFVEHRVVPTILEFFFRFPWNNYLHNVVYDVVQQVFNGPMDRGFNRSLAIDLFQNGEITEKIVEGQIRSEEAQATQNMRLGYMGHLTLVAEEVVKFSDRHPSEMLGQVVLEAVTTRQWTDYVDNTLAETRERDNAILGGVRPETLLGPRQAAVVNSNFVGTPSVALANAGLNGPVSGAVPLDSLELASSGSATSPGVAFSLNSGSLLSGFASSSDEEDEELDELEDANDTTGTKGLHSFALSNELNTPSSHSSQNPSLSFTPIANSDMSSAPPPLNLPPSRARNKLAARLARHGQLKSPTSPTSPHAIDILHDEDMDYNDSYAKDANEAEHYYQYDHEDGEEEVPEGEEGGTGDEATPATDHTLPLPIRIRNRKRSQQPGESTSPEPHTWIVSSPTTTVADHDANDGPTRGTSNTSTYTAPSLNVIDGTPTKTTYLNAPSPPSQQQLSLDSFANSPAAFVDVVDDTSEQSHIVRAGGASPVIEPVDDTTPSAST